MSKMSRAKGRNGEYAVRDHMRSLGWESHRVPFSGAMAGYKGDVTHVKGDLRLVSEVKFYKDSFLSIYALLDQHSGIMAFFHAGKYVLISYNFDDLGFEKPYNQLLFNGLAETDRTVKKIYNMQKLLKGADFLAVKCNHKQLIFLRYWGAF